MFFLLFISLIIFCLFSNKLKIILFESAIKSGEIHGFLFSLEKQEFKNQ
ncbi:hypothetical protein CP10881SC42_0444 [Chlamydia avium]|uniref:Uncharacterized protein n=1 Tax=Chlamydia avium TaxID=1457141 RepID=A0ABN0MSH3_9CHLA|nr:hypothetical protein CP10743SC13_0355 [Chlamydia psittaci 10_743_SC13]EPP38469.1 hypothetical protein CP10881SC42_0444 [Chlamydia avium]